MDGNNTWIETLLIFGITVNEATFSDFLGFSQTSQVSSNMLLDVFLEVAKEYPGSRVLIHAPPYDKLDRVVAGGERVRTSCSTSSAESA